MINRILLLFFFVSCSPTFNGTEKRDVDDIVVSLSSKEKVLISLETVDLAENASLHMYKAYSLVDGKVDGIVEDLEEEILEYSSFFKIRNDTFHVNALIDENGLTPYNYMLHESPFYKENSDTISITMTHDCEACYNRELYNFILINDRVMFSDIVLYSEDD